MPQFVFERLDLAFTRRQQMSMAHVRAYSCVLLHTLSIIFRLHAFQLEPAPVDDFVSEDCDQDGLEYWTTAVLVEVALGCC